MTDNRNPNPHTGLLDTVELDLACPLQPLRGILTGGCPSNRDLKRLAQAGFRSVLDLRPSSEWQGEDFAAQVRAAGLEFLHLPIDGLQDMQPEQTRQFLAYWNDETRRPMLIHCASGNRVGAMLALAKHRAGEANVEKALELGRAAGLTRSEQDIRTLLERAEQA